MAKTSQAQRNGWKKIGGAFGAIAGIVWMLANKASDFAHRVPAWMRDFPRRISATIKMIHRTDRPDFVSKPKR